MDSDPHKTAKLCALIGERQRSILGVVQGKKRLEKSGSPASAFSLSELKVTLSLKLGVLLDFFSFFFFLFSFLLIFFPLSFLKLSPMNPIFVHSEWKKSVKRQFDTPPELPNIQRLGFFYLI